MTSCLAPKPLAVCGPQVMTLSMYPTYGPCPYGYILMPISKPISHV